MRWLLFSHIPRFEKWDMPALKVARDPLPFKPMHEQQQLHSYPSSPINPKHPLCIIPFLQHWASKQITNAQNTLPLPLYHHQFRPIPAQSPSTLYTHPTPKTTKPPLKQTLTRILVRIPPQNLRRTKHGHLHLLHDLHNPDRLHLRPGLQRGAGAQSSVTRPHRRDENY